MDELSLTHGTGIPRPPEGSLRPESNGGEMEPLRRYLTTEIVTGIEGIRGLRADYEHLYRVTRNTLPFTLHEWHLTWCAHFLNRNPRVRQNPLFCVLRDDTGECVAILPLILNRPRLGPLSFTMVNLLGADPNLTEIRSPMIQAGYEQLAVAAVRDCLGQACDWDWIQWNGVSSALMEAMIAEVKPQLQEARDDFILDLPASWREFQDGLMRNVRESLRHCYNSLRRDGYEFEFVVARDRTDIWLALGRFLELHTMRANMAWGPKHPDRFADEPLRNFLYDICDTLAARDAVRIFQLKIGADVVASRIGFVVGDSVYLYYSGFDPAWARYSVMTTTVAETVKYAIANGLRTVNLSPTGEQSKLRWRPRVVIFHAARMQRNSLTSRAWYYAYRAAMSGGRVPTRMLKNIFRIHPSQD